MVPLASTIMKNVVVVLSFTPSPQFRFAVKLICCIVFGSASGAGCLLKSIAIINLCNNCSPENKQ